MADLPTVTVEVGFDVAGVAQNIGSDYDALTWIDITAYVRPDPPLSFSRGRAEAGQAAAAGQLQVTVLNDTGDFTPGDNGGTYGAIHPRMPIRVTANSGSDQSLWVGFVTDVEWLIDSGQPLVMFTASDIIAAAARTTCGPWVNRRLMGLTPTRLLNYWPLDDPAPNGLGNSTDTTVPVLEGERLLSDVTGGLPLTAVGLGGTLSCNVPTGGLSPDEQPNVAFTPYGDPSGGFNTSGYTLDGRATVTGGEFAISMWLRAASTSEACWAFEVDREGFLGSRVFLLKGYYNGTTTFRVSAGALQIVDLTVTPDTWFHVYAETDGSDMTVVLNGTTGYAVTAPVVTSDTYAVRIGGPTTVSYGGWSGQIAHVAMWDTTDITRAALLADRGANLPTAADRFLELPAVTANPTGLATWMDADPLAARTVSAQTTAGKSLLVLAQETADAERGSVVASREGLLTLLSQRGIAAEAPVLSLSATADILSIEGLFGLDDADTLNEVTVTLQPSGRSFTATRAVDPGVESTSLEVWSADEGLAQSLAASIVNTSNMTPRAPSLTISMDWLAHAGLAATALTLELGDILTITGLPASAPASSLTVQVRSIAHMISRDGWKLQVDTDPPLNIGVLDDATFGVLDDTSILGV